MATRLRQHGYVVFVTGVLLVGFVLNLVGLNEILNSPSPPIHRAWLFPAACMCLAITAALCQHIVTWGRSNANAPDWGTLRLLFQALVVGWLGFLFFSERVTGFKASLTLGLVVGLFACGLLLRPLVRRSFLAKGARVADLLLTNLFLIVVGLEVSLRVIGVIHPTPVLARTEQGVVRDLETYRYPPHHVRYGFPCNSKGHFDTEFTPKQAGRPLILAIGDSFSAGVVPHYFHFTTVAERELPGVDVYNMGVPATDPPAYLHLWLTEGKELKPDLLIINVFVGNDLFGCLREGVDEAWLRSWLDPSQVSLFFVPERLRRIARENERAGTLQGEAVQKVDEDDFDALVATFPWTQDPTLERGHMSEEEFLRVETGRAFGVLLDPRRELYAALFDWLKAIRDGVQGTPWMIMLIPDEFQVNDELWRKVLARRKKEDARLDRFMPQRRITRWLEEQGIVCLDLLPLLRAVPPLADGQRHVYHLRDTHFNARGNEVVGKTMAKFVRKHFEKVLR